jgi:hypothetical protein
MVNKLKELSCVFVGCSRIFLLDILIFKGILTRLLYKSFGVKVLRSPHNFSIQTQVEQVGHRIQRI